MPGRNGTGPLSQGPIGGYGRDNRLGTGPAGECVCPKCGQRIRHQRGAPCYLVKCSKCKINMVRV